MSQRTLRQKPRISYFEPEEPSLDEYVFCEKCADYVYEYCSIHGALLVIPDDKVPTKTGFPSFVPRAALTIPHVFLHLNYSTIPGAGLGVFTTLTLPRGVRFGPYRGERTYDITSDYSWQIYDRNNKPSHVVDASDGNKSNWMRYVNCARHWFEQNLVAYQYQGQLYYRTIKIIPRYTELMVFYGSEYANLLEIDLGKYNSPRCYAQKFGAPAPKKRKFDVQNAKKQGINYQPVVETKQSNSLTTTRDVYLQESKNSEFPMENKLQPGKGASAPKKPNKIQPKDKIPQPETISLSTVEQNIETEQVGITNAAKPNTKFNKKSNKKKTSKKIKPVFRKAMKTSDKDKNAESQRKPINPTPEENATNSETHNTEPVKDEALTNTYDSKKVNLSGNNEIDKKNKPKKAQNVGPPKIHGVYFYCEVCNHQSFTKNSQERHIKFHDINRKFLCETCTYRFPTNIELNNHKFRRHGIKSRTIKIYECNICDYTAITKVNLKTHLRTHTGEKPYACSECTYKSTEAHNLKRHLRTHTGEKPYACSECNYKCTQVGQLKIHLRTHTGEKPYACRECDYKSTVAGHLKIHLRTHTGEKPYACSECTYKSTVAGHLKIHLRTHTGEKPYSCDICHYKCAYATSLKNHLNNKHLKQA